MMNQASRLAVTDQSVHPNSETLTVHDSRNRQMWKRLEALRVQTQVFQAQAKDLQRDVTAYCERLEVALRETDQPAAANQPAATTLRSDEVSVKEHHQERHLDVVDTSTAQDSAAEAAAIPDAVREGEPGIAPTEVPSTAILSPAIERSTGEIIDRAAAVIEDKVWILVAAWLVFSYLLTNFALHKVFSASLNMYLAQPLIWSFVALQAFLIWRWGTAARPALNKQLIWMAFLVGAAQVSLLIIGGLFLGFGNSPYSHSLTGLLGNVLYVGALLVGLEMSRAYLGAVFGPKRPWLTLVTLTLTFAALQIPFARLGLFDSRIAAIEEIGSTVLPTVCENLLTSFLALLGGPLPAIAYRGTLLAFEWLSPVLPKLPWLVTATVTTLVPAVGMMTIFNHVVPQSDAEGDDTALDTGARHHQSSVAWGVAALLSAALVLFSSGALGVQPNLIASNSMHPSLVVGDVAVTRQVSPDAIEVGDIIRFWQDDAILIHRVVEVHQTEGGLFFITRGDANNTDDAPVDARLVLGKTVFVVPKIGWVTIGLRNLLGLG